MVQGICEKHNFFGNVIYLGEKLWRTKYPSSGLGKKQVQPNQILGIYFYLRHEERYCMPSYWSKQTFFLLHEDWHSGVLCTYSWPQWEWLLYTWYLLKMDLVPDLEKLKMLRSFYIKEFESELKSLVSLQTKMFSVKKEHFLEVPLYQLLWVRHTIYHLRFMVENGSLLR